MSERTVRDAACDIRNKFVSSIGRALRISGVMGDIEKVSDRRGAVLDIEVSVNDIDDLIKAIESDLSYVQSQKRIMRLAYDNYVTSMNAEYIDGGQIMNSDAIKEMAQW